MRRALCLSFSLVCSLIAACSGSSSSVSSSSSSGGSSGGTPPYPGDPGAYVPLGMNDATILVPIPSTASTAFLRGTETATDGTPLLDRELFERLAKEPVDGIPSTVPLIPLESYGRMQVVAIRFDLCDRNLPGICTGSADGRLRLVFQPFDESAGFEDVSFHAFYAVPFTEIASMLKSMRELAALQDMPAGPLAVSPALSARNTAYATKLRNVVLALGGRSRLFRLTMNAQPLILSQIQWVMRGVEKKGGDALESVVIPGIGVGTERIITAGQFGFEGKPAADLPAGIVRAIDDDAFAAASESEKRALLGALVAAENPLTTAADTVSCIACHTATPVLDERLAATGIAATAIEGRYSSRYDLSVGGSLKDLRVIRALGWVGQSPLISQRVVNDTAQVLTEIEQRFPR